MHNKLRFSRLRFAHCRNQFPHFSTLFSNNQPSVYPTIQQKQPIEAPFRSLKSEETRKCPSKVIEYILSNSLFRVYFFVYPHYFRTLTIFHFPIYFCFFMLMQIQIIIHIILLSIINGLETKLTFASRKISPQANNINLDNNLSQINLTS